MNNLKILKVENDTEKSEICQKILLSLPEWFGIDEATKEYIEGVKITDFLVAKIDQEIVGFYSIISHFPQTSEIYVCGILPQFHRMGIGKALQNETEKMLKEKGVKMVTVKTLSASHPDIGYQKTREFYLACGFIPLEEFKELWDKDNPCLFLAKMI